MKEQIQWSSNGPADRLNFDVSVQEGVKVLHVVHGDLPKPIDKGPVKIEGSITAVSSFLEQRMNTVNPDTSHVEANIEEGTILLIVDADSPLSLQVLGELSKPAHLETIDINGPKVYGLKDIQEVLRTHRFLFSDRSEYDKVIKQLLDFKARVDTTIESKRDTRNSSERNLSDKKVQVEEIGFKIKTELYVGGQKKEFIVEVCCDVTDGSSQFWLESIDLIDLQIAAKEEVINAELAKIKEFKNNEKQLAIIHQ